MLRFTWTGNVVTAVTTMLDHADLKWTYRYVDGRLEEVCDPKSNCTKYSYGYGSHYRSTVLDTRPESYWTLGETEGSKALSQIGVNLGADHATYVDVGRGVPGVAQGSADSAAGFDGVKSRVALPENAIRKNRSVAVELWFKTTKSGPLASFQEKEFTEKSDFNGIYVGTDGKLRGRFTTNAQTQPDSITTTGAVNDGAWHHVVLSADVSSQVLYVDGAEIGTINGDVQTPALRRGELGAGHSSGPGWGATSRWFFQGEIDEAAVYAHPLGLTEVSGHIAAKTQAAQLVKVTLPSGRVAAEIRYDTIRDRVSEQIDRNGGAWKFGAPGFTGNEKNPMRSVRVTDPGNRNHFYDFDPLRGRILRYLAPLGIDTRKEDRPESPPPTTGPGESTCAPQPDGSFCDVPISGGGGFVPVDFQGVRSFGYDDSGFQTTITDEVGHQVVLAHDPRGNVKSRKTCRGISDCQVAYYTHHFNPADLTDPRNDKVTEYRDPRSANAADNTYLTRYSYDPQGRLLEQVTADNASVTHTYTAAGLVETSRDARNAQTTYLYYNNGDLAQINSPGGLRQVFTYDDLGRRITSEDVSDAYPNGLLTTYSYDERSRLVRTTSPSTVNVITGKTHVLQTSVDYDADGNRTRVARTDLTGGDAERVTTTEYDSHGRPERITDAEGGETSIGYDSFGNTAFMVNANEVRTEFAYTARNAVSEVRLRGWNGDPEGAPALPNGYLVVQRHTYDRAGRLVRTTDAMNRTEVRDYYHDDLLRSRSMVGAHTGSGAPPMLALETNIYDAAGNVVERQLPGGRVTKYTYDAVGRTLSSVDDPNGLHRRTAFSYDLNGNITQVARSGNSSNVGPIQAARAEIVDYGYDDVGRRTSEEVHLTTSKKLRTTWEYDQRGLLRKTVPPRGHEPGATPAAFTTEFVYDTAGQLVSTTAPAVSVESNGNDSVDTRPVVKAGYNAFGEALQSQGANGVVQRSEVDKLGRPVKSYQPSYTPPGASQPVEGFSTARYDGMSNVLESRDVRGTSATFEYDQMNRLVKSATPEGSSSFTYTRTGNLLSTVDPNGARTESTYDVFGRLGTSTTLERFPARTLTTVYDYDAASRLAKVKSPLGNETKFDYDVLGSMIRSTDAANVVANLGYDMAGRLVKTADAEGRASYTGYDKAGRVESTRRLSPTGALLSNSSFAYDENGNLQTATDPLDRKTTYSYDALDRLVKQVEPVSETESIITSFGHDAAGNRTRFTDGRQNKTVYTYNTLGLRESTREPQTAEHPELADRTWTTTYNAAGDPVSERAPGGVVRDRTFDAMGRLKKETGSGAEAATTDRVYDYDVLGRMISSSSVEGTDTFTYNDRGQLLTAAGPGGNVSHEYDDDGNLTVRGDASGTARFSYLKGRTNTVQDSVTGLTQSMAYDNAGLLKTTDMGNGRKRTYDYDDAGRLAKDTVAGAASVAYTYDRADRVASKTTTGTAAAGQQTYDYDYAGRLKSWTSPAGTVNYGWDAAGNRTRAGDAVSTYDERNRLRTDGEAVVSHNARGGVTSRAGTTASFDAFDRMVKQGSTSYSYDALDRVAKRNDTRFSYSGTSNSLASDGSAVYGRDAFGGLLAVGQGAEKKLAVTDRHGDLVGTLDPASSMAALSDSAAYDPFGKVIGTSGAKRSVGFQGQWTDPDSGGVNMAARWYNPGSGGFESRDSWTLSPSPSGMANRYSYGLGSPTNYVDPSGHNPCKAFGGGSPCGDDSGGLTCLFRPWVCSGFPGGGGNDDQGSGGCTGCSPLPPPPPNQRNNVRTPPPPRQQPDPSVNARRQAQEHGRRNPLPVPEAMSQPLYGGDRTPPVSSAPQIKSHLAGDYANPVGDVNTTYSALYAGLLEQNGPVLQNVSASLQSPIRLTEEPGNSDNSWESDLLSKCFTVDPSLPSDIQLRCAYEATKEKIPPGYVMTDDCGGFWICLGDEVSSMGYLLFGFTSASDIIDCQQTPGAITCSSAAMAVIGPLGKGVGEGLKWGGRVLEDLGWIARTSRADIDPRKMKYLFSKVDSNPHNKKRSLQNGDQLAKIGINDTYRGRLMITSHLREVAERDDNILRTFTNPHTGNTAEVRESVIVGPGGILKLETTWEVEGGRRRFTTMIPYGK